jgi:hypothetical protein
VDWWVHEIAISEWYRCQPWEIMENWSWQEVWEAHQVLDYIQEVKAEEKAKNVAKPQK